MFNNYWWRSSTDGSGGLNWLSWNNIRLPKSKGGSWFQESLRFQHCIVG